MIRANIQKWGNSLGLRIPMQLAKQLQLYPGSPIIIEIDDNRMIIQSLKYDLGAMLKDITPENRHHHFLDDEQRGNEEW